MTDRSKFSELITAEKRIGVFQDQSRYSRFGDIVGIMLLDWSVAQELARQGLTGTLPAGTYSVKVPAPTTELDPMKGVPLYIPAGDIPHFCLVDTLEAKAGSGTITWYIGATAMTAISATGVVIDTAAMVEDVKLLVNTEIKIVIGAGGVTAGAFRAIVECYKSRV